MAPWTLQGGSAALLVARACIAWGLDNNLTSVIDGVTPAQTTLLKGQAAGSLNVLLGVLLEPSIASGREVLGALGVGAIGYGLSLVLYISGAQQLGATRSHTHEPVVHTHAYRPDVHHRHEHRAITSTQEKEEVKRRP